MKVIIGRTIVETDPLLGSAGGSFFPGSGDEELCALHTLGGKSVVVGRNWEQSTGAEAWVASLLFDI